MRLHILSDLHIEFEPFDPPTTNSDIIILAGDIHVGQKGIVWIKEKFTKPVIYVIGNHEYYGQAWPKHVDKLKTLAKGSNIHILENEKLSIDDMTFMGCTLWTDFRMFGDPRIAGYEATQKMNDYKKIRMSPQYRKLRSVDIAAIHNRSITWLTNQVKEQKGKKLVIITHHAPSKNSVPKHYQNDILSAAYASQLDDFVSASKAKLWIHGHLHVKSDYNIGKTRVVCNPKGYPDEFNDKFIPDFVLEV
jgi:Icc-related predicted phosphoesterase